MGSAQIAGNIAPGVNLKARHQAGVQMSCGFQLFLLLGAAICCELGYLTPSGRARILTLGSPEGSALRPRQIGLEIVCRKY